MFDPLTPSFLIATSGCLALLVLVVRRSPALRRRSLDRFAAKVDLPPPAEQRPRIEDALTHRAVAAGLGIAVGTALVGLGGWLVGAADALPAAGDAADALWALVVVGGALAGGAGGVGAFGLRQATREPKVDGPRIARPTAPTLGDYVAPLELQGARLMALSPAVTVLAGTVLALVSDLVELREVLTATALIAVVIALVSLAAGEVAGRRLLDQPQLAGSSLELAWSDAIRARVLRDIVTAPLAIGVYATMAVLIAASGSLRDDTLANAASGLVGLWALGVLVVAAVSTASRPQRHFHRRLWRREGLVAPSGSSSTGSR